MTIRFIDVQKVRPKLFKELAPEYRKQIERQRWPPAYYLDEAAYFEKCLAELKKGNDIRTKKHKWCLRWFQQAPWWLVPLTKDSSWSLPPFVAVPFMSLRCPYIVLPLFRLAVSPHCCHRWMWCRAECNLNGMRPLPVARHWSAFAAPRQGAGNG